MNFTKEESLEEEEALPVESSQQKHADFPVLRVKIEHIRPKG